VPKFNLSGFVYLLAFISLLLSGCCGAKKQQPQEAVTIKTAAAEKQQPQEAVILKTNVKITADQENEKLVLGALWLLQNRTPAFARLVEENVEEIRQSKGTFTAGPIKTIGGTARIEFKNFVGRYNEYNIALFLVHEATHIVDIKNGLPLTRAAEIKAREAEISFLKELESVENRSLEPIIKFVQNEIRQIQDGKLYSDLD